MAINPKYQIGDLVKACYTFYDYYYPDDECGILWNDPDLNIIWPTDTPIVSDKDKIFKKLSELKDEEYPTI